MAKSERRRLAEQIAGEKNIKVKSAMRYLQRATTGAKQKIKNPTFRGLSETTAKKAKRTIKREIKKRTTPPTPEAPRKTPFAPRYPETAETGAFIDVPNAPNITTGRSSGGGQYVAVTAYFEISRDRGERRIRLFCSPGEVEAIEFAGSLYDAVAEWTNAADGYFLQGASIRNVKKIEIL
jgi:hypothetical protein